MKTRLNLQLTGIALLLIAGLAACDKPGPAETAGKKIDQTAEAAGRKIESTAEAAGKKIENTAEAAGRKIENTVDKVGDKISDKSDQAGVAIDDTEITAKIKGTFFAEPGLKTLQISVDTVKGVVTLTGSVNSMSNIEVAGKLAGAVAGVREVKNLLVSTSAK